MGESGIIWISISPCQGFSLAFIKDLPELCICETINSFQLNMAGFLGTALLWYYSYSAWFTANGGQIWVLSLLGGYVLYWTIRAIYRLYFHPLAKYPGSSVAAISTEWWATLTKFNSSQKLEFSGALSFQHISPQVLYNQYNANIDFTDLHESLGMSGIGISISLVLSCLRSKIYTESMVCVERHLKNQDATNKASRTCCPNRRQ